MLYIFAEKCKYRKIEIQDQYQAMIVKEDLKDLDCLTISIQRASLMVPIELPDFYEIEYNEKIQTNPTTVYYKYTKNNFQGAIIDSDTNQNLVSEGLHFLANHDTELTFRKVKTTFHETTQFSLTLSIVNIGYSNLNVRVITKLEPEAQFTVNILDQKYIYFIQPQDYLQASITMGKLRGTAPNLYCNNYKTALSVSETVLTELDKSYPIIIEVPSSYYSYTDEYITISFTNTTNYLNQIDSQAVGSLTVKGIISDFSGSQYQDVYYTEAFGILGSLIIIVSMTSAFRLMYAQIISENREDENEIQDFPVSAPTNYNSMQSIPETYPDYPPGYQYQAPLNTISTVPPIMPS